MMHKASRLALFAALVISLVAGASVGVSAKQSDWDCKMLDIKQAQKDFELLNEKRSNATDWHFEPNGVLVYEGSQKVQGVISRDHIAYDRTSGTTHLMGSEITSNFFSLRCVVRPDGSKFTKKVPEYAPKTAFETWEAWNGARQNWEHSGHPSYMVTLEYREDLGNPVASFVVPRQTVVYLRTASGGYVEYTPGYLVPSSGRHHKIFWSNDRN